MKPYAQLFVVLLCAFTLKVHYSTSSVNQLRWILAPTTFLVELATGSRFQFESHAGYVSSDHSFVIAASCAGVNFLITSFLMLSLRALWRNHSEVPSRSLGWRFIPVVALVSYVATLVTNTVRISTAVRLHGTPHEIGWLSGNQLHRFEGIFIYFGFLLLLFMVSETTYRARSARHPTARHSEKRFSLFRQSLFPLLVYYATTLGMPLANGAFREGANFWEHSLFVLLIPLLLIIPLKIFHLARASLPERIRNRPVKEGLDSVPTSSTACSYQATPTLLH